MTAGVLVHLATLSLASPALLRLRGGDVIRPITDRCAGVQLLGGAYGYAYPEDNIRAFGGKSFNRRTANTNATTGNDDGLALKATSGRGYLVDWVESDFTH